VTPPPFAASADTRLDLIQGLLAPQAHVAPKFLYDRLGSRLFEAITELAEYYPTRTETSIFDAHAIDMAGAIGAIDTLVDLGAGNCAKALRLIPTLAPNRYVAVDISADFLTDAICEAQRRHPSLEVCGLGLDFSTSPQLPPGTLQGRSVFFYPGSSIGNFSPPQAHRFLKGLCDQAADGGLLIGVDLVKPLEMLEPAYDDALGVTAAFNLNLLRHVNRLIGSDFNPREWRHVAFFNRTHSRVEMHLEARHAVAVTWHGGERHFAAGERLHTENSHKYSVESFSALLRDAGFSLEQHWLDAQGWFAVFWAQR
jgi:dimethylhistidine N-methyltransferase